LRALACPRETTLQSAKRVYNTFMALDEDGNGLLSRAEFSQISNGSMSPLFIQVARVCSQVVWFLSSTALVACCCCVRLDFAKRSYPWLQPRTASMRTLLMSS
jgi:hypothetical protein